MDNGIRLQAQGFLQIDVPTGNITAESLSGVRKVVASGNSEIKVYLDTPLDQNSALFAQGNGKAAIDYGWRDDGDGEGQYVYISWSVPTSRPVHVAFLATYTAKGEPLTGASLGPIPN